jgi:hypothetical protein
VTVVEGLVASVLLGVVDPGGVMVDEGDDEVVPAVLVPYRQLVKEAEAEEKEDAYDQLPGDYRAQVSVLNG